MKRHKRIVFIVVAIMFFISSQLLFADFMSFDLKAVESGVTRIEYRLGKDSWQEVDMNTLQINLPRSATDKTLQLRLYGKNKKSSVLHNYRYDDKADTWVYVEAITETAVRPSSPKVAVAVSPGESVEVTLSPYATVMLTDNALKHMYTLPVGVGLDASLSFPFHRGNYSGSLSSFSSNIPKKESC